MTGSAGVILIPSLSTVIPDGSRERADPGPKYPSIGKKARQGYLGPGSRALGRSAGMTIEKPRIANGGYCGLLHV
jgi:hypothetical protein